VTDRCHSTNSQKPNEELIENFKASFPHLAQPVRANTINNPPGPSLTDALDVAHHRYVHVPAPCCALPLVVMRWPNRAISRNFTPSVENGVATYAI